MHRRLPLLLLLLLSAPAASQDLPPSVAGPPPPQLPATVARDGAGQVTVRAVRVTTPLTVDGILDEDMYRTLTPMSDFIQEEPQPGAPATEKTEVWLSFDADNIYVSMRASESQPDRMVINEMRRDSANLTQNENFLFAFDTFHDGRNGVAFQFNPIGGRADGQAAAESAFNVDWNPIWRLAVRRLPDGWTAEAAVPFKSLRFKPGVAQVWGFQARRINRWKNETSYLTALPPGLGVNGFLRASRYAAMVGLDVPSGSRALDLKPYVNSNLTTDPTASPTVRDTFGTQAGFDAKYGVTQNLAADFTYNTDFAQVEADEQQVNLTRFNLFFPEKREFFLENQGIFAFAAPAGVNGGSNPISDVPKLFHSRSIGLAGGRVVPLDVGGRLSGRIGHYGIGLLNIQSEEVKAQGIPRANIGVVRISRDILRRSSVGMLYTRRAPAGAAAGETYGVDSALALFQNLFFNLYWARTETPGVRGNDVSYRTHMNYSGDRYGLILDRNAVGDHFNPQVGFLRRDDFVKIRIEPRFSPRPRHMRRVRKFTYLAKFDTLTNHAGVRETLERSLGFTTEFQTSDRIFVSVEANVERLPAPFAIARNVTIPPGEYDLNSVTAQFVGGQQRRLAGAWTFETGPFYAGTRHSLTYTNGRVMASQRLAMEPGLSLNRVTLPWGDFTATLVSTRTTYTVTPQMFVSGLVQYNSSSHSLGSNVRLRWEYQQGSELFVVYNDARDLLAPGLAALQNRAIVVKINRLFRF